MPLHVKCLQGEQTRFRQLLIHMDADAKGRQKAEATMAIQQRIDTLNERFMNNEIDLYKLLDGLTTAVAKQH